MGQNITSINDKFDVTCITYVAVLLDILLSIEILCKHYQFLCGLPNRQGVAGRATMAGRDRLYAIMNSGRYGSNSTTPS